MLPPDPLRLSPFVFGLPFFCNPLEPVRHLGSDFALLRKLAKEQRTGLRITGDPQDWRIRRIKARVAD